MSYVFTGKRNEASVNTLFRVYAHNNGHILIKVKLNSREGKLIISWQVYNRKLTEKGIWVDNILDYEISKVKCLKKAIFTDINTDNYCSRIISGKYEMHFPNNNVRRIVQAVP